MNKFGIIITISMLVLFIVLGILISFNYIGYFTQGTCGQPITTSQTLTEDLVCSGQNGIAVGASSITLNCQNNNIRESNTPGFTGIQINEGFTLVTVQNCNLIDWSTDIQINTGASVTLSGVTVDGNSCDDGTYATGEFDPALNCTTEVVADTTPPTFTQIPNTITLEYTIDSLQEDFEATDDVAISGYSVNDTDFDIYSNGTLVNVSLLEVGTYYVNVSAIDTSSNTNSTTYQINVEDTTPPTFTDIANIIVDEESNVSYDVKATDPSGVSNYTITDNENFTINYTNGNLTNATSLSVGVYHLNITVNDTYNNINTQAIWVNITDVDTLPPTFTYIPDNSTLEYYTQNLEVDFNAIDETGFSDFDINDSNYFSIYENGTLINISLLPVATYLINVSINDTSNNINSTIYEVDVVDTISPVFTDIANISIEYGQNLSFNINATDYATLTYSINTTPGIDINSLTGVISNTTNLSKAEYHIEVNVSDGSNVATQDILINITGASPTLIQNIPDVTFTEGSSSTLNLSQYFSDIDNATLIYTNLTSSNIISINQATSIATISSSSAGTHYSVFRASDGVRYADSNNITITIQSGGGGGGSSSSDEEQEPEVVEPEIIDPDPEPQPKEEEPTLEEEPIQEIEEQPVEEPAPEQEASPTSRIKNDVIEVRCGIKNNCDEWYQEIRKKSEETKSKVNVTKEKVFNDKTNATEIKINIQANETLENFEYYQSIPKCMAFYADLIEFKTPNYEILKDDPLVVWHFATVEKGQMLDIGYEIKGKIPDDCYELLSELLVEDREQFSKQNFLSAIFGIIILLVIISTIVLSTKYSSNVKFLKKMKESKVEKNIRKLKERVKKL